MCCVDCRGGKHGRLHTVGRVGSVQRVWSTERRTTSNRFYTLLQYIPLTHTVAVWVQLYTHPVPDRVKPSFVIFDIRALWHSVSPELQSARMSNITNDAGLTRSGTGCLLYSCTHLTTVGVKGLNCWSLLFVSSVSHSGARWCVFRNVSGDEAVPK